MRRCICAVICAAILALPFSLCASASGNYPKAATVTTADGRLNVRSSAGGGIITSIDKGSSLIVKEKSGSWYRVEYGKNKFGYCSADFITVNSSSYAATVKLGWGNLNVRSSAGGTVIDKIPNGETVVVTTQSGDWSKILYYGNQIGFVSSRYLAASSYSAKKLSVPSYKQTDSRWANTKIGSTSYTIGKIGCTTTALAMTESYRTGTTIYPNEISKRLSYSSSGSLYWPSNYSTTQDFSNYLERIYNLIQQGKPVIIGAKKANGTQHWVVVTGVYSVNTLSTSAFTINDPGTSTRTALVQFLKDYPYLHRIVWY